MPNPMLPRRPQSGLIPTRTRPLRNQMQEQPADRQDGQYLNRGEVPQVGTRPITPLWEDVPSDFGGEGDIEFGLGGGGGASAGRARATTRSVEGGQLVENRLNGLIGGNSTYMQNARRQGLAHASERGNINGSMAAGSAQRAALDAALPIASQDAAWVGRTAADNMDAENQVSLANAGFETNASIASANNDSSLRSAILRSRLDREQAALGRNFERESNIWDSEEAARTDERRTGLEDWASGRSDQRQFGENARDRNFRSRESERDRDWQSGERERDRNFDWATRRDDFRQSVIRDAFDTIRANPEYFRDPEGAAGAIEFFNSEIDRILNQQLDEVP